MNRQWPIWLAWTAVVVVIGGCVRSPKTEPAAASPAHAYRAEATLPDSLRRVAVLPLASRVNGAAAGAELMSPWVLTELQKRQLFDLVPVSRADLRAWTGREQWSPSDELPARFLTAIRSGTGCDAVLLGEVTRFSAYPPLAVGLKLCLVSSLSGDIAWFVDESYDAGSGPVAGAARNYGARELRLPRASRDTMLQSPRKFGQFAAAEAVRSAPGRTSKVP